LDLHISIPNFKVAPAEIEQCLLQHPAVADAAVVGILDEYSGELPFGFIVRKDDESSQQIQTQELQAFVACKSSLCFLIINAKNCTNFSSTLDRL